MPGRHPTARPSSRRRRTRRRSDELMSHMAGFTYGFFGSSPVDKMYLAENLLARAEPARLHHEAREAAAGLRAWRGVGVQRVGRRPGISRREALGTDAARTSCARGSSSRSAWSTRGSRSRRASSRAWRRSTRSMRRRIDLLRGRGIRTSRRCRACRRAAAGSIRPPMTTCGSRRCCSMAASWMAFDCSRRAPWR